MARCLRDGLFIILTCFALLTADVFASDAVTPVVTVGSTPMHSGRITNMLYGGFIELLDDLVPGMWAEMLNDRGFEGVKPLNWSYYMGEPNICDRDWDKSECWAYDTVEPFNGRQSAKITSSLDAPGSITQQDLYVEKGKEYTFTGNFRTDKNEIRCKAILKSLLPDGKWMILASADLGPLQNKWSKLGCRLKSNGTTDRAVFELKITGDGSVWADKLSLMPADNIRGWRKDVAEVIKAAKPGVIRFGGSLQEFGYKWDSGIGERDQRQPFWNQYWGRWDTNDVGIEEFIDFCRVVCAEPLICVGFNEGIESACRLIEYCNGASTTEMGKKRAENGHIKPLNVKFWQIGNECWGEKYDRACADWCIAMRKVDPNITLLAADDTQLLLQGAGKYLDYVAHHYYYIRDARACMSSIKEQQKIALDAGLDHTVKMAVTEWNITAADWGLGRGQMLTLGCALDTAKFLNVLNNCSDFVGLACRSNLTNSCCSGYIITNPSGILKTPCYHVMKLYADHYKPVPITVAALIKGVDISACRSEDGKHLTIFAVNTNDAPIEVRLDLKAYGRFVPKSGEVVCDTLDRRQYDLMNNWTAPDRVKAVDIHINGDRVRLPAFSVSAIECSSEEDPGRNCL